MSAWAASPAHALPCSKDATIFSCTTQQGKFVQVCDQSKTLSYWFGKQGGKAELALSVPRNAASTCQWAGVGRNINYSVDIPNGDTVYQAFTSADRNEQTSTSGINVLRGEKMLASMACKPSTLVEQLHGIQLKAIY